MSVFDFNINDYVIGLPLAVQEFLMNYNLLSFHFKNNQIYVSFHTKVVH